MDVPLEVTLGGCDMPDVLVLNGITYVSEPAKTIIESHDPFGHQFWPIKVCDESGGLVTNKPYYHMNMRRYVTIESQEKPMLDTDFSVHPELEGKHIATIQQDDRVRAFVVSLPLWIHYYPPHSLGHALFMNEVMYKALCERGMKGIKQFTQYGGRQGELVAHV
ncbi:imm11 family protein [Hahella ganghwensis]|uniref:imm11 family protein n=1 Tax=Hahella ganghwensis TaxID=286420 RepID=UPI0003A2D36A|nr:DUF1629 domain-containing protein [Hahella ganghwensis]